jgi:hypothetical protein
MESRQDQFYSAFTVCYVNKPSALPFHCMIPPQHLSRGHMPIVFKVQMNSSLVLFHAAQYSPRNSYHPTYILTPNSFTKVIRHARRIPQKFVSFELHHCPSIRFLKRCNQSARSHRSMPAPSTQSPYTSLRFPSPTPSPSQSSHRIPHPTQLRR